MTADDKIIQPRRHHHGRHQARRMGSAMTPRCLLPWVTLALLPVLAAAALLGPLINLWRD